MLVRTIVFLQYLTINGDRDPVNSEANMMHPANCVPLDMSFAWKFFVCLINLFAICGPIFEPQTLCDVKHESRERILPGNYK